MINQTRNNRALFGLRSFGVSGIGFVIRLALLGPGIAAGQTAQPTAFNPTEPLERYENPSTPTPGQITLIARGYKVQGHRPSTSPGMELLRTTSTFIATACWLPLCRTSPGPTPITSGCVARARTPIGSAKQARKTVLTRSR